MTATEKYLVVGAGGKTGGATAYELLKSGHQVRALVRKADARSEKLKKAGAEIFVGNMADYHEMKEALKGIQRAYFVAPWTPDQLHIAMTFAAAAAESSAEHLVAVTQWLSNPTHPSVATRESFLTDQIFGLLPKTSLTKINVGWFADNYMPPALLATISQLGIFPFPLGAGKTAPISNEDIARVITAALTRPDLYAGGTYRPTGPDLLSPQDLAKVFSRVAGRKVTYQNIPSRMFLKALQYMEMHPHMQSQLQHYVQDYQLGSFERDAPNSVVLDMTGHHAEDFETIARRYFAATPGTKKSMGNKLAAISGFIKLALTRPYNIEKHDQAHGIPTIKNPQFAKALGATG